MQFRNRFVVKRSLMCALTSSLFPSRLSAKLSLHDLSGQSEKLREDNTDIAKFPSYSPDTASGCSSGFCVDYCKPLYKRLIIIFLIPSLLVEVVVT